MRQGRQCPWEHRSHRPRSRQFRRRCRPLRLHHLAHLPFRRNRKCHPCWCRRPRQKSRRSRVRHRRRWPHLGPWHRPGPLPRRGQTIHRVQRWCRRAPRFRRHPHRPDRRPHPCRASRRCRGCPPIRSRQHHLSPSRADDPGSLGCHPSMTIDCQDSSSPNHLRYLQPSHERILGHTTPTVVREKARRAIETPLCAPPTGVSSVR
jgi:hypothetical protein